ncbi:hypothetical protein C8Q77DRAFT_461855 [Trametes polyzona]|nr:hypothetical protein C8Q77DRAFT_461855 [Trametes polyzona]
MNAVWRTLTVCWIAGYSAALLSGTPVVPSSHAAIVPISSASDGDQMPSHGCSTDAGPTSTSLQLTTNVSSAYGTSVSTPHLHLSATSTDTSVPLTGASSGTSSSTSSSTSLRSMISTLSLSSVQTPASASTSFNSSPSWETLSGPLPLPSSNSTGSMTSGLTWRTEARTDTDREPFSRALPVPRLGASSVRRSSARIRPPPA